MSDEGSSIDSSEQAQLDSAVLGITSDSELAAEAQERLAARDHLMETLERIEDDFHIFSPAERIDWLGNQHLKAVTEMKMRSGADKAAELIHDKLAELEGRPAEVEQARAEARAELTQSGDPDNQDSLDVTTVQHYVQRTAGIEYWRERSDEDPRPYSERHKQHLQEVKDEAGPALSEAYYYLGLERFARRAPELLAELKTESADTQVA